MPLRRRVPVCRGPAATVAAAVRSGAAGKGAVGRAARALGPDKAHIVVEVVERSPLAKGFEVLRRRWIVERTVARIVKNRRFVRDCEQLTAVAETLITIAATATLVRRWP